MGVWRDGDRERSVELKPLGEGRYQATVDGVALEVQVERLGPGRFGITHESGSALAEVTPAGTRRFVRLDRMDFVLERAAAGGRSPRRTAGGGTGGLESPMPGVVTRVMVEAGETVRKGQPLVAVEAMKMEHLIRAPRDGRVVRVATKPGEMVNGGVPLVEMQDVDDPAASRS